MCTYPYLIGFNKHDIATHKCPLSPMERVEGRFAVAVGRARRRLELKERAVHPRGLSRDGSARIPLERSERSL